MDFDIPKKFNETHPSKVPFNDWLEDRIEEFELAAPRDAKGIRLHFTAYRLLRQLHVTEDGSPPRCDYRFDPCTTRHRLGHGLMGWFKGIPVQLCAASDDHKGYISISDEQYPLLTGD